MNLEELTVELEAVPQKLREAANVILGMPKVVHRARELCPVKTGALRDSIRVERLGLTRVKLVAGGYEYRNPVTGLPVNYAIYVHEGTSKMPARPFLKVALAVEKENLGFDLLRKALGL